MKFREVIITQEYTSEDGWIFWVEVKERLSPGQPLEQVYKFGSERLSDALKDVRKAFKSRKLR